MNYLKIWSSTKTDVMQSFRTFQCLFPVAMLSNVPKRCRLICKNAKASNIFPTKNFKILVYMYFEIFAFEILTKLLQHVNSSKRPLVGRAVDRFSFEESHILTQFYYHLHVCC